MILVTGATGKVGREVVTQLSSSGQRVRALVRDPSKARFDATVEIVAGDLMKPDTLAKAVEGIDKIFSVPVGPETGTQESNLAEAAKKAGVRHIVKLSVLGAGSGSGGIIPGWHEAGEKALKDSGIAWTFLRPGSFMANALNWVGSIKTLGIVTSPFGDGKFPPIHHKDIAAVGVKALTSAGHEGKAYPMTGPEALSVGDQVRILSEAVGKPIKYVALSEEAAKAGMVKAGMPGFYADALLQLSAVVRNGHAAQVLPTVSEITGRQALTFATWVGENIAAFR